MRWIIAGVLAAGIVSARADQPLEARLLVQVTFVSGLQHFQGKKLFPRLNVGDDLTLVREPDNTADSNAIRVEWRGRPLGYIPQPVNPALARQLDFGNRLRARIIRLSRHRDPDRRVELEIYLPL